jgi:hypothetical protein
LKRNDGDAHLSRHDRFWNESERRLRARSGDCVLHDSLITVALALVPILHRGTADGTSSPRLGFSRPTDTTRTTGVINIMIGPLLTVAIVGGVAIAGRWLDHRPFSDFGAIIDRYVVEMPRRGVGRRDVGHDLRLCRRARAAGWVTVTGFRVINVADVSFAAGLLFILTKVICAGTYRSSYPAAITCAISPSPPTRRATASFSPR